MRFIPLNLAVVYLSIATLSNPVWATTIEPISKTKPIPIACYIRSLATKRDHPISIDSGLNYELKAGNFDRVLQLIVALKLSTVQQLHIRAAIIRQAITNNRNDIIDAAVPQIVQLNSQVTRERPAYLGSIDFWNLPLSLAQDLIKADRKVPGITPAQICRKNHIAND